MKNIKLVLAIAALMATVSAHAQYNQLWIPDTLMGPTFNLTIKDTFKQMLPGNQTITSAINNNDFWGPTLIINKGDVVHMNVHNQMGDTTTMHWHGMHLPAIMDGGPHQIILPFTTWSPYWLMTNNAGTYWYHPHLHKETLKQMISGIGGFLIVRDSAESALNLPRTYGVDDIPLVITDRKFDAENQFIIEPYGDYELTNGVMHAEYTVPAQIVRFRILAGSTERSYEMGFSDNRDFKVIASDAGLLDTPVTLNRLQIAEGERYEILVDFSGETGTSVNFKAFNSELSVSTPGNDTDGVFPNLLNDENFNLLHINVGLPTINPVTYIPHHLVTNTSIDTTDVQTVRVLTISDSSAFLLPTDDVQGIWGFLLNRRIFDMNYVDYSIPLDNTEIWELRSTSYIMHPFHIHDVAFKILDINGASPPPEQSGWKDVVAVPPYQTVRFITKFDDYADALHPYMFHCHIVMHEDDGMMGQFVVGSSPAGIMDVAQNSKMTLFPNPAKSQLSFRMSDNIIISHASVINVKGQTMKEFNDLHTSSEQFDLSSLDKGFYFLRLTDISGGSYIKSYLME